MKNTDRNYLLILIAGLLLYVPFLGSVHLFDWDEINFAEAAREMIVTGDYLKVQINFLPFWEKPPLFIWMQVLSMKLFGVNEFAARFPNAVVGIVTLLAIYSIGKKLFDKKMGLWWVLAFAGSVLPQFYFKSGIIDPAFNLLIFLSVYFLFRFFNSSIMLTKGASVHLQTDTSFLGMTENVRWILLSGLFIGLAVLTKGPVALLILGLCWMIFAVTFRSRMKLFYREYLFFLLITFIISASWFVMIGIGEGWNLLGEFIQYQFRLLTTKDAGHGGPFYYHFVVLLIGCFPASAALFMLRKNKTEETAEQKQFRIWMIVLLIVTLVLFSIVKTKIIHYSSLCYFPLSFLAAFILSQSKENLVGKRISAVLIAIIGIPFSIALIALPYIGNHIQEIVPYIKDKFAQGNMQAEVDWSYSLALIGIIFFMSAVTGFLFLLKARIQTGFIILLTGTILMVQLTGYIIVPRIEKYSQGAAIEFYQSKAGEGCYVEVYGFKSYAYLFYTKKKMPANSNHASLDRLLKGEVDKPVYIVGKITSDEELSSYSTLEKIGEKNGFVFYKRK